MKKYFIPALYVTVAVAVFVFLGYKQPWLMSVREESQLWLCSSDYLWQRVSEPGGVARYLGEFIVQSYYLILLGSIVTALLFFIMLWLWWITLRRLWRYYRQTAYPIWLQLLAMVPTLFLGILLLDINVQMTLPVAIILVVLLSWLVPQRRIIAFPAVAGLLLLGWWLAGPVIVLLPLLAPWTLLPDSKMSKTAVGIGGMRFVVLMLLLTGTIWLYAPYSQRPLRRLIVGIDYVNDNISTIGTPEEQQYEFWMRLHLWNRMLTAARKQSPKSRACQYAVMLAEWKQDGSRESELRQCYHDTWHSLSSCTASFLMSDLYLQLGWVNMSQRAAHDALVSFSNYNSSGRALKRIAEMGLITGQYELVVKYATILERAPFYHAWAREALQMAEHPELIDKNPNCLRLRQAYIEIPDGVFY